MKDYQLITDSTCDLPEALIKQNELIVIPMEFELDGQTLKQHPDGREIRNKDFYDALRQGKKSVTSMINTNTYLETFKPHLNEGRDILYLSFSSALSGTYNASRLAIEELKELYPEREIRSVDTRAASVGQGLLVLNAARKRKAGAPLAELATWVEENRDGLCHWFTVEDLHHLKRGGRIGAVSANVGTALNIKPILTVDKEGRLVSHTKVRGRKKSLMELVKYMETHAENPSEHTVFIGHGDSLEDAQQVAEMVRSRFNPKEVILDYIGPVIGTHTGPGIIGLCFTGKKL